MSSNGATTTRLIRFLRRIENAVLFFPRIVAWAISEPAFYTIWLGPFGPRDKYATFEDYYDAHRPRFWSAG